MNKSIFAGLVILVILAVTGCRSTAIGTATPASSTASAPASGTAAPPSGTAAPPSGTASAPAAAPPSGTAVIPASGTAAPAATQAAGLATTYNTTGVNLTYGISSDGTLTHVTENAAGDISGQFTVDPPLYGSGPFTGTVNGNAIKFTVESVTPNPGNATSITFTGTIGLQGSLSGTYVGYTSDGRPPESGTWTASPATAPVPTQSGPPASCGGGDSAGTGTSAGPPYYYAGAYQYATADGAEGTFTVADPKVVAPDCHSLAELAVESSDGNQIVEVGWTVDPAQFGDDYPHLFVYHWVNRVPSCYDGCGFVSTGTMAGESLEPGSSQTFEIKYVTNEWAIFDNNFEVGYFPGSLWSTGFTQVGLADWFGEVADGSQDAGRPCSQMGDGQLPAADTPAEISGISFIGGPSELSLQTHVTNASYYDVALSSPGVMRFGGPGGCTG